MRNELEKCFPQNLMIYLLKHQTIFSIRFLYNDRTHIEKLNPVILEQSNAQKQNLN